MGARNLSQQQYAIERDTVKIYARGTGAGTSALTSVKGKGVTSITRQGVGTHTVNLTDTWNGLLAFSACVIDATTPDDWEVVVTAETVASTKTVAIAIFKGGTAADLSTDEKILIEITVSRSANKPTSY